MSAVAITPASPLRRLVSSVRALPRSVAVALAGIAVIALHVADDSFVQPQPGVSAGDNLVSGLVPLALLGLAAWGYPRARAGARAAVAAVLGVFALVTSVEAVYYTRDSGPSGDDYTGLLAIPAGLALIVVAVVTLWRTRRLDDRRLRRYPRRGLLALACVAAFAYGLFPLGMGYITTHVGRTVAEDVDLGPTVQDVTLTTSDGLTLHGSYIPSTNGAAVIASPGYNDAPAHARMLARHGYGVLLFDQRGEGRSDGDPNAFGWEAELDLRAAIGFLQHRPDVDPQRIGGLGLSVAGEAMLQTAAHTDELRAVVSEGAGVRSYREWLEMPGSAEKWLALPLELATSTAVAVFGDTPPPADLSALMRGVEQPVFLIYSEHGVGNETLTRDYYAAAAGPRTLWEVSDGGHTEARQTHPQEYERRIVAFLDGALLGRS